MAGVTWHSTASLAFSFRHLKIIKKMKLPFVSHTCSKISLVNELQFNCMHQIRYALPICNARFFVISRFGSGIYDYISNNNLYIR